MLPQPNFGRDKGPIEPAKDENGEDAMPRKKLRRLQIALWVQVVFAVLLGNLFAFNSLQARNVSQAEILKHYQENPPAEGSGTTPEEMAKTAYETFQSTGFLVMVLVIAGFVLVAAIVSAMCAIRLKSRLKAVRWSAVAATAILFVVGMYMSTQFGLLVAPWVFASVLALWWLFASDIRYWLSETPKSLAEED
ncbi:hypothetical protein [Glycomyces sp. YM15]|uniref:hypothetical protein n=1 Tax=Glycomyces sp. YM15 TaxID=2800446 RepID=UPI001966B587|nr:hypothetical protein [Glycomyces sp. YM15]